MAMQIETYDEREITTDGCEPTVEAMDLIHELELDAQLNESGSRICYPRPTMEQVLVLQMIFGKMTPIKKYDAGTIPYRVLKEIKAFKSDNPGMHLWIFHAPIAIKDPVLVASNTDSEWSMQSYPDQWRLIARWGDALEPWEVLYEKAVARYKAAMAAKIEELKHELDGYKNKVLPNGRFPSVMA